MLKIAPSRKLHNGFRVAEPPGGDRIKVKAKDFISVGYVNIIVMKSDSKRQVQMIGKGFARHGNGLFRCRVQYNDFSGG